MAKKAKKKKDAQDEDTDADVNGEENGAKKKKGGKGKLIIIIVVAALVVLGGTGGGLFYMGFLDSMLGIEQEEGEDASHEEEPIELGTPIYYEIPEFVADLKVNECRAPFLKLSLTIQIDQNDKAIVDERQPKIIDRIQMHLREQERQDLVGEAGAESLRADIVLIIDATIKPSKVQNVLFKSMVLQ